MLEIYKHISRNVTVRETVEVNPRSTLSVQCGIRYNLPRCFCSTRYIIYNVHNSFYLNQSLHTSLHARTRQSPKMFFYIVLWLKKFAEFCTWVCVKFLPLFDVNHKHSWSIHQKEICKSIHKQLTGADYNNPFPPFCQNSFLSELLCLNRSTLQNFVFLGPMASVGRWWSSQ